MTGSWRTGKLTEFAMKHFAFASACRAVAASIISPDATVTRGRSTTSVKRAEVQVPEHVALGQRGGELELRVPPARVTAERRVGAPGDDRGPVRVDLVRPVVLAVPAGAGAAIPGPGHQHVV